MDQERSKQMRNIFFLRKKDLEFSEHLDTSFVKRVMLKTGDYVIKKTYFREEYFRPKLKIRCQRDY